MCEAESCLTVIYESRALPTSTQPSSDNSAATTLSKPSRCQAKKTPCVVNQILCGCKCAGKSWQRTPSWISTSLWRANCKTSRRGSVVRLFGKWGRQQGKQTSFEGFSKCSMTAVWWAGWEGEEEGGRIEGNREGQHRRKAWGCWQSRGMAWEVWGRKMKRWKD